MRRLSFVVFVVLAMVALTEGVAAAASGRVLGTWKFQQYGGGYCPESGDPTFCEGARYLEEDHATAQPIRSGKMYVENNLGQVLGTCPTDENGDYECTWYAAHAPTHLRVRFKFENYEGRFKIVQSNGVGYVWQSSYFPTTNGHVKFLGTITMPRMGLAQLFDAGTRVWEDSLSNSIVFQWLWYGVEVRAYVTGSNSDLWFDDDNVRINVATADKMFETFNVMHEFGHAADYFARPRDLFMHHNGAYCYPNTSPPGGSTGCSHSANEAEWRGVARAEGIATFFALTAWFDSDAPQVRSCLQDGESQPCSAQSVEYAEDVTVCSGDKGRREYTSARYYWDLFDPVNESGDNTTATLDQIAGSIYDTPFGYDWGERESFYASDGQTVDVWDSFHSWEWNQQFESYTGLDSSPVYFHNCLGYF